MQPAQPQLKEIGFTPCELRYVLRLAGALKLAKYGGSEVKQESEPAE